MSIRDRSKAPVDFKKSKPQDWRELICTGTAYIEGKLEWCGLWGGKVFNDNYLQGANEFHNFTRMSWCDPKDVQIVRDRKGRSQGFKSRGADV
jgi:hypothetical protein